MDTVPQAVVFDLDSTLAVSKQAITPHMAATLSRLLSATRVAVISGGALEQFLTQIVAQLPSAANLSNLYLLPTSGAALYTYKNGTWAREYEERLSEEDARTIDTLIRAASEKTGLIDFSDSSWGERIEYRGAQVTLSALGQQAPVDAKKTWDPDHAKRETLRAILEPQLPEFSIKIGGMTSLDVTKRGIDKAYGIRQLSAHTSVPISAMLYVGDALFPGGNDEIVKETGIETRQVADPDETERVIEEILSH